MRFSQRAGITPATKLAQRESIDDELRNSLWSFLMLSYWSKYREPGHYGFHRADHVAGSNMDSLITILWLSYFKRPVDTIETFWEYCLANLRKYFFSANWYEVYDFVEFVAEHGPEQYREQFIALCNGAFEHENSAYRFLNGFITEVTSKEEIEEVENALVNSAPYAGVKTHLESALALLSDRRSPNYRNSIKESISSVESLAKKLSGDDRGTLGVVLKALERSKKLHPALKNAFTALYGYTNDADGIRHALLEETNLTKADARFMLICCSAFINYAIEAVEASQS